MKKANKARLTAGRIRDFENPREGQDYLWDTEVQGLGVRATPNIKRFILNARLDGRQIRLTIGDVRTWDIDQARAEARRLQRLIDRGIDPRDAKKEEQAQRDAKAEEEQLRRAEEQRRHTIVGDAWTAYLADRRQSWSERNYQDHINLARLGGTPKKRGVGLTTPGPLASLLPSKLIDINPETLCSWLKDEAAQRPTQARQAFGAFRTFSLWCQGEKDYSGLIDLGAFDNRKVRDALPAKTSKDDVLQKEQLPAWFSAVGQLSNPIVSAYLQVLLLTGARRNELTTLTWAHVDFEWSSLTIKDKVEGERTIPLTPYVSSLLASLPRQNGWVFCSPSAKSGRLTDPRMAHNRALEAAGLPPVSLHGLRRSFGTLAEWVEMPVGISAQIMGHKPSALAERHYRRRPLDLLRQWHTKLERWILDQAGIRTDGESS